MKAKLRIVLILLLLLIPAFLLGGPTKELPQNAQGATLDRWQLLDTSQGAIQRHHVNEVETETLLAGAVEGILKVLEYYEEDIPEACYRMLCNQFPIRPLSEGETTLSPLAMYVSKELFEKIREDIIDGALYGMMGSLDPFSGYMPKDVYDEVQMELEGEYGGVGVVITLFDNRVTVQSIFKGTPGSKVDINPGDIIEAIDGESTEGLSLNAVAQRIRGKPGTKVAVTLYRPSLEGEVNVVMTRAIVEIPYVEGELLTGNIGLITLTEFAERVGEKTYLMARELIRKGADKIILDLRNNPGGLLTEAVNVSSIFMPRGPVVHIANRSGVVETLGTNIFFRYIDLPIVVLVNKGSASASEIVSAAIQEQGTGILIGTDTFGKGSVQTLYPLIDGSALRLTTAKYYTSKMNYIHETGLEPDIFIELEKENFEDKDTQLEAALEYLLKNELKKAG